MMKTRLFTLIIERKLLVSAVLLGLTLFFGWHAAGIVINSDTEMFLLENDVRDYSRFLDEFGTDKIIAIAFETEDAFSIENLGLVDSISRELEQLPNVDRVYSLTTAKTIYGEDDTVHFGRLMDAVPSTREALALIEQRASEDPFIPAILLSLDAQSTAIIAEVDHVIQESYRRNLELVREVRTLLEEHTRRTGKQFYLGGRPVVEEALYRYTQADNLRVALLSAIFMALITFVMFRRIIMTILPMLVVLLTVIWTHGIMSLLGHEITSINIIIRPLLMAVAIAGSMHMLADYLQKAAQGGVPKLQCIQRSFSDVLTPCFMASVTTAVGLLSLMTSDLAPLRDLGLAAAAGVLSAFVISTALLPIALIAIRIPQGKQLERVESGILAKLLRWLGRWERRRAVLVIIVTLIAMIPAVWSLPRIVLGTNMIRYLKPDDGVRRQIEWIDAKISGTGSLEFLIETEQDGGFANPSLLRRVERIQDYLRGIDGVTEVHCVVDLIKTLNRAFHGGEESAYEIPGSSAKVSQQLLVIEGSEELGQFLSSDSSKARIMARVREGKARDVYNRMPQIDDYVTEILGADAKATTTGALLTHQRTEDYIVSSQIRSFILAFVVIQVVMTLILRSIRLGMLAMIPNFLPILFGTAMLPFLGMHLDIGTTMPAIITLGLVVDDSIHFLSRLRVGMERTGDVKAAIAHSMKHTGRPIVFTSIVLGLGFLALLPAKFVPAASFGVLSAIVIAAALAFDLVVLPAVMGLVWSRRSRA
jgi:predicted RND superfamily exporter protein